MNELIANNTNGNDFRKRLLATASAMAFGAGMAATSAVHAEDADRPTVWIELGGQMERSQGTTGIFTAPFFAAQANSPVFSPVSPAQSQRPPQSSFGEEGSISIQPKNSDWTFTASLRYGRSGFKRLSHQQTNGLPIPTTSAIYQYFKRIGLILHSAYRVQSYDQNRTYQSESHTVLDFQAGRDVGLGMFGAHSTSVLSAGIRMARFSSDATVDIRARPDVSAYDFNPIIPIYALKWHNYHLSGASQRSFRGLGPSVSWSGSAPLIGNLDDGEIAFDWGGNAAVLFGRQKAKVHHYTYADQFRAKYGGYSQLYSSRPAQKTRSRSVVVPNIGGLAGLSYRFTNASLKIGYRADMFFNAMDTGIDTRKTSNVLFHGPYASISIGLGG
jgi:hypothetical protein